MDRPEEHSGLRDEVSPIKSPNSVSPSYRAITRLKSGGVSSSNEIHRAQLLFHTGNYVGALEICERIYEFEAYRTENLLLLGAIHFQLHSFSESIFFSQQAIRVDPNCGEAYSNMGNSFKELGDTNAAIQFYLQVKKKCFCF
jgi:tetratricopeptide (TPR) repeat protein